MKRFMVIGLGNFGFHVASTLYQEGHEVIAVDQDRDRVHRLKDLTSYAIVADAASKDFLRRQGVQELDAVIVSTGERSHLSTLITMYLKELGVKRILVKALDEDHGRILEKIGATDIIFPERETARKLARALASPNILEFLPLSGEEGIHEVSPPPHFIGKNLIDLDLRKRFNVTVIAVKDVLTDAFTIPPVPSALIKDSDVLIMLGRATAIEKACKAN